MLKRSFTHRSKTNRIKKSAAPRSRTKTLTDASLKKTLGSIVIWVLVVVNVFLLYYFVQQLYTKTKGQIAKIPDVQTLPVKVEILNGCGVSGIANVFSNFLERKQYVIVNVDNAPDFNYRKTIVIDKGTRDKALVDRLRSDLGISDAEVLPVHNDQSTSDATIIIGADYASLRSYQAMR